jgi:5-methylthioribose kinase
MQRLLCDTLGFTACKMMRRIVGLAKVADIADIPDPKARSLAETQALTMATKLLVQRHQYTTIHAVSALAQSISSPIENFNNKCS